MGYETDKKDEQQNAICGGNGPKKAIVGFAGQNKAAVGGVRQANATFIGPYGGLGGTPWDDGSHTGVRLIKLKYGDCIDSIQTLYDDNGSSWLSPVHGGLGGEYCAKVELRFPNEYLISVSGHYGQPYQGSSVVIRSLTFKSNWKTFGPFGKEEGTPFSFEMSGSKIDGFGGRASDYLDSIGFYIDDC